MFYIVNQSTRIAVTIRSFGELPTVERSVQNRTQVTTLYARLVLFINIYTRYSNITFPTKQEESYDSHKAMFNISLLFDMKSAVTCAYSIHKLCK